MNSRKIVIAQLCAFVIVAFLGMYSLATILKVESVHAQGPTYQIIGARAAIIDTPTIAMTTGTADTTATPTTGAMFANWQIMFGTVAGSFGTCTAQPKTTFDGGTTWLTLGSAVSITITTGTINAFTIIGQLGTTSVTASAASASAALEFGAYTKLTLACSSYGTSAPATVNANFH
jgi:hypothetical protein